MQKLTIVKIGGNIIDEPIKLKEFLGQFVLLPGFKILVHGGGKVATRMAQELNIETKMVDGRRITTAPMRDVVLMVYGGLVNKNIVARLQAKGCNAIGLSGADGRTILSEKRPVKDIDYGFVGDVKEVNYQVIAGILSLGLTPVFAPLSFDKSGEMLNTNADTIASVIAASAASFFKVKLVYCFEKKGVLDNPIDDNSVIESLNQETYVELKKKGIINKGMIPKLDNAFDALRAGAREVIICNSDNLLEAIAQKSGTIINL